MPTALSLPITSKNGGSFNVQLLTSLTSDSVIAAWCFPFGSLCTHSQLWNDKMEPEHPWLISKASTLQFLEVYTPMRRWSTWSFSPNGNQGSLALVTSPTLQESGPLKVDGHQGGTTIHSLPQFQARVVRGQPNHCSHQLGWLGVKKHGENHDKPMQVVDTSIIFKPGKFHDCKWQPKHWSLVTGPFYRWTNRADCVAERVSLLVPERCCAVGPAEHTKPASRALVVQCHWRHHALSKRGLLEGSAGESNVAKHVQYHCCKWRRNHDHWLVLREK